VCTVRWLGTSVDRKGVGFAARFRVEPETDIGGIVVVVSQCRCVG
jgi:hypothetical protein